MVVENIGKPDDDLHLRVMSENGAVAVWLDTNIGTEDGVCLTAAANRRDAIEEAIGVLREKLRQLEGARRKH